MALDESLDHKNLNEIFSEAEIKKKIITLKLTRNELKLKY